MINTILFSVALAVPGVPVEERLKGAHQAYLDRDYASMTSAIREVLRDEGADQSIRSNALALIGRAFDDAGGKLPADWRLPEGLSSFKFKQIRKELPEAIEYKFSIKANMPEEDSVKQVSVSRYPNRVILDRDAGIGEWVVEREDDGAFSFDLGSEDHREPLAEGLYLFTIVMKDGARVDGWFPLQGLASSESPSLASPAVGETIPTGNPEFRWNDFRSPEYRPSERRSVTLSVGELVGPNYDWIDRWTYWVSDPAPTTTRTTLGHDPDGTGVSTLTDGKYWLSLTYFEQSSFGELKLRRGSRTARPFFVKSR